MQTISDNELKSRAEDDGITLTDDPYESIFVLRDGTGISGDYEMGVRGTDHNCLTDLVEPEIDSHDPNFWSKAHAATGVVRLVPETNAAMVMVGQQLTEAQSRVVNMVGAEISEYVEAPEETIDEHKPEKLGSLDDLIKQAKTESSREQHSESTHTLQKDEQLDRGA